LVLLPAAMTYQVLQTSDTTDGSGLFISSAGVRLIFNRGKNNYGTDNMGAAIGCAV
jgi:hypothetical protein